MDATDVPESLRVIFFPFRWDKHTLWKLPTPAQSLAADSVVWHLDLSVWSTHPPNPLFNLRPRNVIEQPELYPEHWVCIQNADTAFPIEMFRHNGRWVIMDGYHRLARQFIMGASTISVRMHPSELLPLVRVNAK